MPPSGIVREAYELPPARTGHTLSLQDWTSHDTTHAFCRTDCFTNACALAP